MPTRPYRVEFPDATLDNVLVRDHNCPTLEAAIDDARHTLGWVLKSDGSPGNDAYVAVITNRDTGYRWILHRNSETVEFQTPGMLAEQVADDHLDVYLSVEEAEALAGAAESAQIPDKRTAALVKQATAQIRLLAGQVREARRQAQNDIRPYTRLQRSLQRRTVRATTCGNILVLSRVCPADSVLYLHLLARGCPHSHPDTEQPRTSMRRSGAVS